MIKLGLLNSIGLQFTDLEVDEKALIKIEKLLKVEMRLNPDLRPDDIENLLVFLKSDWQEFKACLENPNVQHILFDEGPYECKEHSFKQYEKEKYLTFFAQTLQENILNYFQKAFRGNEWVNLKDVFDQYKFLFGPETTEWIYSKLQNHVEVILSHIQQKKAPSDFQKHFSLQDSFYDFLVAFDANLFEPIDNKMQEILLSPIEGHGQDFYDYFNTLKKRLIRSSNEAEKPEGCSEKTMTILSFLFVLIILGVLYLIYTWSTTLFWTHLVAMFVFTRIKKIGEYLNEEEVELQTDGEIVLNKSYWKSRMLIRYFFITFLGAFVISIPSWLYILLAQRFTFLKGVGIVVILLILWGNHSNNKDEEKAKKEAAKKKQE